MVKRSLSLARAATPRGVACAFEPRYVLDGSGVAPGAKTFFGVLAGMLGENRVEGGLSLIVEARKMLRAETILLLLKWLAGSSRSNGLRAEDECGVPTRFAEPPNGDAAKARFAKGRGGRDLGVAALGAAASPSPGNANVTIAPPEEVALLTNGRFDESDDEGSMEDGSSVAWWWKVRAVQWWLIATTTRKGECQ